MIIFRSIPKNVVWWMILMCILLFDVQAQTEPSVDRAEELFRHAQTYHWLGRAKHSNSRDFLISQEYTQKTIEALRGKTGPRVEELRLLAETLKQELDIRYENNFDNIVNELPLFALLTNNQPTYEYVDDPQVLAVNRAQELAISNLPQARPDLQYYTVVVSKPVNKALEDELRFSLGNDIRFFPRPDEDILKILSKAEYKQLYDYKAAPQVLAKLAKGWDKQYVLYVELVRNDLVDDVYYYGVYLRLYNTVAGEFTKSLYADGFTEDRLHMTSTVLGLFGIMVLLSLALPWVVHLMLAFQPRRDRGTVAWHSGIVTAVIGVTTAGLITAAFIPLAPEPATLMVLLHSRFWFIGYIILLTGLPILLSYLAGSRISGIKDRMGNANTLAAIISGSIIGAGMLLGTAYITRFGIAEAVLPLALLGASAVLAGTAAGLGMFRYFSHGKVVEIVPGIIGVIASGFLLSAIVSASLSLMCGAAAVTALIYFVMIAHKRIAGLLQRKEREQAVSGDEENRISIKRLEDLTAEPRKYVDQSETGDFIENRLHQFFQFYETHHQAGVARKSPFFVYRLSGNAGTGKTRTAEKLADELIKAYKAKYGYEGKILFGDCDEMNSDGSGVPFEPFAQAFHKLLGAGRFEPPSKRAAKIANGLKSAGLETALGVAGLGVLGSLMGLERTEDDISAASSSIAEMAYTLSRALIELSKHNQAPIVLILDDMHFIDALSEELFEKVVNNLSVSKETEGVVFILTENPSRMEERKSGSSASWLQVLQDHEEIGNIDIHKIDGAELSNPERFDDLLIDALWFSPDAAYQLLRNIQHYKPDSIMGILQTVAQLIHLDGVYIDERANRVNIKQNFNFEMLPPPTSLQELVMEKLNNITAQQRNIVECAAFVGYEFNAEILADVLGIDRLVVLHELRELESNGVLHDVVDQDDVYAFNSTALAAAIRHQTNIRNIEQASEVPQVVREYHHRVALSLIKRMERFEEDIETIGINNLIALARRSYAAGDRMIGKAFEFNSHAAARTAKTGRYTEAATFASQAIECAGKLRSLQWSEEALRMKALLIEMGTIQVRSEAEMSQIVEDALVHAENLSGREAQTSWKGRILSVWSDYVLSSQHPREKFEPIAEQLVFRLQSVLEENGLSSLLRIRVELSLSRLKLSKDSAHSHMHVLEDLYGRLGDTKQQVDDKQLHAEALRLESEILEDWGIEKYNMADYQGALSTTQLAIDVKKSFAVNDVEGIAKLQCYQARCSVQLGNGGEAQRLLVEAHAAAERVGALNYKIESALLLGKLLIGVQDERVIELYIEVLQDAHSIKDKRSEVSALNGILHIASTKSDSMMAKEYEREVHYLLSTRDSDLPESLYEDLKKYAQQFFQMSE